MTCFFTDSPVSLAYRSSDSTVSSSIRQPVNFTIEVKAYPRTVSFKWYLKHLKWIFINSSDERFLINSHELKSALNVRSFSPELAGTYKVTASNGIRDPKEFLYILRLEGSIFYKMNYFEVLNNMFHSRCFMLLSFPTDVYVSRTP